MASSERKPDLSLDLRLRDVPLPDGLTARLRAAILADDDALDALLRYVSVPEGFLLRLRCAVLSDDAALDALLQQVVVPQDFIERLQSVVEQHFGDEIDHTPAVVAASQNRRHLHQKDDSRPIPALDGVGPIPSLDGFGLMPALDGARSIPALDGSGSIPGSDGVSFWGGDWFGSRLVRGVGVVVRAARRVHPSVWATAAALWALVGVAVLAAAVIGRKLDAAAARLADINVPPLYVSAPDQPLVFADGLGRGGSDKLPVGWSSDLLPSVSLDLPAQPWQPGPLERDFLPNWARAGGAGRLLQRPWVQWTGVLGSPSSELDRLPELKKVSGPAPRGVCPPLVPQFPLDWYNRYGVFPFVSPGAHPRLQTSVVPLEVDTASYDLMRRYLEDGELPAPRHIHTEHFLAAIDYAFPAPRREPLALHVAAGPSPFGGEGLTLLQIGVQGKHFQRDSRQAVQLVLAVDSSGSMRWGGRLDMVRKALGRLVEQLGPQDRLWLVKFSHQAEVLLAGASATDREAISAVLSALKPEDSTNIAAGLHAAFGEAEKAAELSSVPTRVVLLTDGASAMDPDVALALMHAVTEYSRQFRLDVIDLGQSAQAEPQLAALARSGGGRVFRAGSTAQVNRALLEIITGQSQQIAADVRLQVTFDPVNVLQYRLFGHEAVVLLDSPTECDFFAGQSATALYELRLKPTGGQRIAIVELSWQPCEGGERQRIRRVVNRREFAPKLQQAPASLKAAAMAAQTAEILRRTPILRTSINFADVAALADQIDSELRNTPDFAEFMGALRQLEGKKPQRSGAAR